MNHTAQLGTLSGLIAWTLLACSCGTSTADEHTADSKLTASEPEQQACERQIRNTCSLDQLCGAGWCDATSPFDRTGCPRTTCDTAKDCPEDHECVLFGPAVEDPARGCLPMADGCYFDQALQECLCGSLDICKSGGLCVASSELSASEDAGVSAAK